MSQGSRQLEIFLSDIYYVNNDNQDVTCHCAVRCGNKEEFDKIVKTYLAKQNAFFVWSADIYESIEWIRTFGAQKAQIDLITQLNNQNINIALSQAVIKKTEPTITEEKNYLVIENITDLQPLDLQFGVWEPLTVPDSIYPHMFGEPEPNQEEIAHYGKNIPPMQTYAILDGAKMPYLLTAMLSGSELKYQSLFQGKVQEELGEHAPYLVKLEEGNSFTRRLFTQKSPPLGYWEKELGIFLRSRASFDELRNHCRKFIKVQDEAGKWYYFRFWDNSVIGTYLMALDNEKAKVFMRHISIILALGTKNTIITKNLDNNNVANYEERN